MEPSRENLAQPEWSQSPDGRQAGLTSWFPLFLISALSLYMELAVIRWIAGEVRIFSYFKNLTLLAAILGLALGFAAVRRRELRKTTAPLMAALVLMVVLSKQLVKMYPLVYPGGGEELLWNIFTSSHWLLVTIFFGTVLTLFLMVMLLFISIGQAVGLEMSKHAPVPAYMVNIIASLVGVWLFALSSQLQTPPLLWFGLSSLGIVYYQSRAGMFSRPSLVFHLGILAALAVISIGAIWSPYQKIIITEHVLERESDGEKVGVGYTLDTQAGFHQFAFNLSPDFLSQHPGDFSGLEDLADSYALPYQLLDPDAEILIIGAGMGNDVAAALRAGVRHVDAVEIDPAILSAGIRLHPERPYEDPRVEAIVDDARSFIRKSEQEYDAIIFGLLDSHTLLSSLSSVRLDSFVYTLESFTAVREHLEPHGVTSLTFATLTPWIEERLGSMLETVFGEGRVFISKGVLGTTFVAGQLDRSLAEEVGFIEWKVDPLLSNIKLPSDDWPYLYLRSAKLPGVYWQVLLLIGLTCLIIISRSFPDALRPDWHFWLLGTAFLLIEFKSITELALLFGTTWLVNAIAISGVLFMVLLANIVVFRTQRIQLRLPFILLLVSLGFLYFFPIQSINQLAFGLRVIVGGGLLSLPLFFSGLIFGESLRRAGEVTRPFTSNLSGAMVGGFLEYSSLLWGIKSLYLIALPLYLLAWIALYRDRRA